MNVVYRLISLVLFLVGAAASPWAESVLVRSIKVTGNRSTDPAVVRALVVEAREGQSVDRADLEAALPLLEARLTATGYFVAVRAAVVDSPRQPGAVNLVIEVEEGFGFRFGGGPVYASFGVPNLGGQGKDLSLTAGTTIQALGFADRNLPVPGLSYTLGAQNRSVEYRDDRIAHRESRWGASGALSQDWGGGWTTSVSASAQGFYAGDLADPGLRFVPGLGISWVRTDGWFSPRQGARLGLDHRSILPLGLHRESADLRAYLDLEPLFLKAAFRVQGAVLMGPPPEARDALSLSGSAVRKPFSEGDLGRGLAVGSVELRTRGLGFALAGFVPVEVEPALVADTGAVWGSAGQPTLASAWGGALRVRFADPVNLVLNLEATVSGGQSLVAFTTEAPF